MYGFIFKSRTPEEIADTYRSLTLEQVYATITSYLHKKEDVSQYLADWIENGNRMREEQNRNPSPFILKLRRIAAEQRAAKEKVT